MRSSLISANTSNEGDRNRQVDGIFYLGRLSMGLSSSRLGPGLNCSNSSPRFCIRYLHGVRLTSRALSSAQNSCLTVLHLGWWRCGLSAFWRWVQNRIRRGVFPDFEQRGITALRLRKLQAWSMPTPGPSSITMRLSPRLLLQGDEGPAFGMQACFLRADALFPA